MGRKIQAQQLYVYMNSELVGSLLQRADGILTFTYSASWLTWPYARPVSLSMPLTSKEYTGVAVYNFFDNLLPDSKLIRDRLQRRFATKTNRSFDLLYHIGADCIGALQLLNQPLESSEKFEILGDYLTDKKIAEILKDYKSAPLGMQEDSDFRISIAGAQEKTAFLRYKNRWYLPRGVTPTTHILKLPIGRIEHSGMDLSDSVENEWLCMQILQAYGLPTAKISIANFADTKALVVERFDRVWAEDGKKLLRIPQEDMCQALGISSNLKYESDGGPDIISIMDVLRGSANATADRYIFMKTVFLYWVMGAIDGHAKNFSIMLQPGGKYNLAPLYDVISAYPLVLDRQLEIKHLKMAMAVRGKTKHYKWQEIQFRHWLKLSELCKFPQQNMLSIMQEIFDTMEQVLNKVNNILPDKFPNYLVNAMFSKMLEFRHRKN